MSKILIIGSKGFIGSNCLQYFAKQNHEVWQASTYLNEEPNCFYLTKHNSDFNAIFSQQQFDICINASGSAHVGFSFDYPSTDFELNVVNVQKILVAIRDFNPDCKFINFSSAAVYGNPANLPITETSLCKPLSPYGFHKLQSELLLTQYHIFFGLKTCSLRVFSAYGKGLKKQLFWDMYQKFRVNDTIELFGTGNESRDFIHIDDVLQAIDLIIQKADFDGQAINIANQNEHTIASVAHEFNLMFAENKNIQFNKVVKQGDPLNWKADISKLKNLGYQQRVSLEEGIQKYILWVKELQ